MKFRAYTRLALCLVLTCTLLHGCRKSNNDAIMDWVDHAPKRGAVESQIALSKIDLSQCDPDWRDGAFSLMSEKYFGEGNYAAAFEWQLKQPDAMNHVIGGIFNTAYLARLAGDDAWLKHQLKSMTSDSAARLVIQAQELMCQHAYPAVLDTLKTEGHTWTPEETQWYLFLRAEALYEMKEYERAEKGCIGITPYEMSTPFLRRMLLLCADANEGKGDTTTAIALLEMLKQNLSVDSPDVSWNTMEQDVDSRLAKLKASTATSTSCPS
jgi:hypothetical protein